MTEFIAHRVNKIGDLIKLPNSFGAEIDLRDHNGRIVIEHDPFNYNNSADFEEYLQSYKHGTLILNIKSERIEEQVLALIHKYKITNYFLLDSSFPMIKSLVDSGEKKIALRFSEFEGLDTIRNMSGKVDWIWVDCFTKLPIDYEIYVLLKEFGYKLCLVSPDLQGRREDIKNYNSNLQKNKIAFDAICVKLPNIKYWSGY